MTLHSPPKLTNDIRMLGDYVVKKQPGGSFDVWRVFIASDTGTPWFYYVGSTDDPDSTDWCLSIIQQAFPQ